MKKKTSLSHVFCWEGIFFWNICGFYAVKVDGIYVFFIFNLCLWVEGDAVLIVVVIIRYDTVPFHLLLLMGLDL